MTFQFFDRAQPLVLATHNKGKIAELKGLLSPYVDTIQTAAELGLAEPAETGTTLEENATIKALAAVKASGKAALADDTGIHIPELAWWNPVLTKNLVEERGGFEETMRVIVPEFKGAPIWATFECCFVLAGVAGNVKVYSGRVEGQLVYPARKTREGAFGFEPYFLQNGQELTWAEIPLDYKNEIGHRAMAMKKLSAFLKGATP